VLLKVGLRQREPDVDEILMHAEQPDIVPRFRIAERMLPTTTSLCAARTLRAQHKEHTPVPLPQGAVPDDEPVRFLTVGCNATTVAKRSARTAARLRAFAAA
jgi:hypothetical protein